MVWTCCFSCVWRCSYCLLCILILLEIDIASDMRDEATRGQHKICWICELRHQSHVCMWWWRMIMCNVKFEKKWHKMCAFWGYKLHEYDISRCGRRWKITLLWKTREMRWSLEYESESNMICYVVILTYQRGTRSEPPLLLFLSEHRSDEIYMASGM